MYIKTENPGKRGRGMELLFFWGGGREIKIILKQNLAFVSQTQNDKFGLKIHESCASRASIYLSYVATILSTRVKITENPGERKNAMFVLLRIFSLGPM